jgi:hypothetical protein
MHQQLLEIITRQFELQVVEQRSPLLDAPPAVFPPLSRWLETGIELIHPDSNEKTRSELLVAPLLFGVAVHGNVSIHSGNEGSRKARNLFSW